MDNSIFTDKTAAPDVKALKNALGKTYSNWEKIKGYVFDKCRDTQEEWNFSKFGWNCRLKERKCIIIYLMPCDGFFKVSMVLGKRAVELALESAISEDIKTIIRSAKTYTEGTGFRIDIRDSKLVTDVKMLIDIKQN